MALRIRIEHGQDAGTTWRLSSSGVYRFGRSPQASVQVLDMKVSKEHFEIVHDGTAAILRDLGSTHGTLLNQQRVPPEPKILNPGDEIRAGLTVLRVLSDGASDKEAKPTGPLPQGGVPSTTTSAVASSSGPASLSASTGGTRVAAGGKPTAPTGPPDPLVGTLMSGYRLLERVGSGGMGAVYRAEQLSLHREVALKVLSERLVSDSAFVDQFVNEARAAGQLNHPNVVQVYDVGQADGHHFFSMEFIHGGSLEGKIPRTGTVPWQEALNWFLDAANALIFAEKKGILHRDIKPDNFMIGQDGSVKLCDLGLAKKSEAADLLAQGIIGTPHFIAPEAIRRKSDVDRRADLYSLGCTFYRILTGKNPYPAPTVKDILLAHLNSPVPRVSALVKEVPKELDEIVHRLMQKEPAQRFENAAELWEALDKLRVQHGMEAHGLHPGRAKKLAILGGVVAVAAIGTLIALRPWEEKTREVAGKDRIVTTGISESELNESNARSDFNELKAEMAQELGRIEEGENWKDKRWETYAAKFTDLAAKYAGTKGAGDAEKLAASIRDTRSKAESRATALAQAKGAATQAVDQASRDGLAAARSATHPIEQEKAIDAALAKVREAAKAVHDGKPLLEETARRDAEAALDALRREIAGQIRSDYEKNVAAPANEAVQQKTATALAAAVALYEGWSQQHEKAEGGGEIAKAWNETRSQAETAVGRLRSSQADALKKDRAEDLAAYWEWLARRAYAPRADDGSSGDYAAFRFNDAADGAEKAAAKAKTPEYRALFTVRAEEARRVAGLPGILARGFTEKGFKDRLAGRDWNGTPQEFKPDHVVVGAKQRPYREEGIGWFHDLFFEKGAERYPLDADAWEGLGVLAEAATILESAARADTAVQAFQKASDLDPKRRARLAARIDQVRAEQRVRALLDESEEAVRVVQEQMDALEPLVTGTDTTKSAAARKDVLAREGEWRTKLTESREKLNEAETKHPNTVGRAILGDRPPAGAAYAGETSPPPAPAAPPSPAPAPAAPSPAPAPAAPSDAGAAMSGGK